MFAALHATEPGLAHSKEWRDKKAPPEDLLLMLATALVAEAAPRTSYDHVTLIMASEYSLMKLSTTAFRRIHRRVASQNDNARGTKERRPSDTRKQRNRDLPR
ncbi:MAG TPA: hypothetical protein DCE31_08980, partial [Lautropia sp.]|nr:hypothetical protein [Lautropia sp.]